MSVEPALITSQSRLSATSLRRRVPFVEYESKPLPMAEVMRDGRLDLYDDVQEYFKVYFRGSELVLQPGGYVGLIPINDHLVADIAPRFPIQNLERLILLAAHTPVALTRFLRTYAPYSQAIPSFIDTLAQGLIHAVNQIEAQGLFREYHQRREDTAFPRGRLLVGETARRNLARGVSYRVTASWFERSIDNAPNRCLKYAIWFLGCRYAAMNARAGNRKLVAELNRLFRLLNTVELDHSRRFLCDLLVIDPDEMPSVQAYYRPALHLARTIIEDRGVALGREGDEIVMASLLIRLEDVFEAYLRAILRQQLRDLLPSLSVLDGNKAGDGGGRKDLFDNVSSGVTIPDATPDIVVCQQGQNGQQQSYPLLVEVKYKIVQKSPEREDINQAITYAVSYRAPTVILAHPLSQQGRTGLNLLGRIGTIHVYSYAFDLSADDLQDEELRFTNTIRSQLHATVQH